MNPPSLSKRSKGASSLPIFFISVAALCGYFIGKRSSPSFTTEDRNTNELVGHLQPIKIPRIIHHMWLGESTPEDPEAYNPDSRINPEWRASCLQYHSKEAGWQHIYWNYSMAETFLHEKAPWFLAAWKNYSTVTHRADSLRYFAMYFIGGLYVDSDVECWREGSDLLGEYDVVLQGSQGHGEPATNAVMASVPQHPLWKAIFKLLDERKNHFADDIGYGTGPQIISDGLYALGVESRNDEDGNVKEFLDNEYTYKNTKIRVYPLGSWFHPCPFSNKHCHTLVALRRGIGIEDMSMTVGIHHYTASWIRGLNHSLGISSMEDAKNEMCKLDLSV